MLGAETKQKKPMLAPIRDISQQIAGMMEEFQKMQEGMANLERVSWPLLLLHHHSLIISLSSQCDVGERTRRG
jgi:hypothetical protein